MSKNIAGIFAVILHLVLCRAIAAAESDSVKEVKFDAPDGLKINLRMEGPYTADVPLQIVCYFKYTPEGVKQMSGAPVELDKRLGGVIGRLREQSEFVGDELETLLLVPPANSIPAKALLLIGLGDEKNLSLATMERVGRTAMREAMRLGVAKAAFAPLIRDQGNSTLDTGDAERAVSRGAILAYDTDQRLGKLGVAKSQTLHEWNVEAGAAYFDTTQAGLQKGIEDSKAAISKRANASASAK
jgi:Cytosol aminopeptidase family, N-terminal domain